MYHQTTKPIAQGVSDIILRNLRREKYPGWNDVSWHNPNIQSPALERLAEEGIKLDQYYVQSVCTPSRVAFLTGIYPYR